MRGTSSESAVDLDKVNHMGSSPHRSIQRQANLNMILNIHSHSSLLLQ